MQLTAGPAMIGWTDRLTPKQTAASEGYSMSRTDLWGPYYFSQAGGFAPQTSFRVEWGLSPEWWSSTFTATGLSTHSVVSVSEPSIGSEGAGPRSVNLQFLATFNNIGSHTIDVAIVFLSRVGPT